MNQKHAYKLVSGGHRPNRLQYVFLISLLGAGLNLRSFGDVIFGCQSTPPELVANGDFETHSACPTGPSQLNLATPWFQPAFGGTPDLFDACSSSASFQTPANFVGYAVPHSGQAYGGGTAFTLSSGSLAGSREYLVTPLISPMVAGKTYEVSCYVRLCTLSRFAIDNLGVYLSAGNMPFAWNTPPHVRNPAGHFITDTNSWTLITGNYTAAGGEDHLTFGNFYDDAETPSVVAGGYIGYIFGAYYYLDDVSVRDFCGCPQDKSVNGNQPWTFDTPTAYSVGCADTTVTLTILNTVTNGTCPALITRTWVATDACGNSNTCSQIVTVLDTPTITFCPDPVTYCISDTNNFCGLVPDVTSQVQATSSGGNLVISQSIAPGTAICGNTNIIITVTNGCGGYVSRNVSCEARLCLSNCLFQAPCPTNMLVVYCTNAQVFYQQPDVIDACTTNWHVVFDPTNGSYFAADTTNTVNCLVTDDSGHTNFCQFTVTVICPPSIQIRPDPINNYNLNLSWPQVGPIIWRLQNSTDLVHWTTHDVTNLIPPFVISNYQNLPAPRQYYRLFLTN